LIISSGGFRSVVGGDPDLSNLGSIGKCPACGEYLRENEIDNVEFRGTVRKHFAYRCEKCETIIGFSSYPMIA